MAGERGMGQGEERAQAKAAGWECGSAGGYRGSLPSQGREPAWEAGLGWGKELSWSERHKQMKRACLSEGAWLREGVAGIRSTGKLREKGA